MRSGAQGQVTTASMAISAIRPIWGRSLLHVAFIPVAPLVTARPPPVARHPAAPRGRSSPTLCPEGPPSRHAQGVNRGHRGEWYTETGETRRCEDARGRDPERGAHADRTVPRRVVHRPGAAAGRGRDQGGAGARPPA